MTILKNLFFCFIIYFSQTAILFADELNETSPTLTEDIGIGFSVLATVVLVSKWASKSPKSFGTTFAVFTPIATHTENGYRDSWPILLFFESLAIYNISEKNTPEDDLYKNNLSAFGAFFLIGLSTSLFEEKDKNLQLSYSPRNGGGFLSLTYEF